ncbi:hypothetical protein EB796_004932 [Bugula neritina]|uniref:Uncharacterized protein n=1 Tax=Bugula neritina TaxID=10212 RepID=A0A7J7KDM8_BUGNE|nr:hypothetical protein EB796_004932 [Bugula neritina]
MSGSVRHYKMKGGLVLVYSDTTRKHTKVHFLVGNVTSLCKATHKGKEEKYQMYNCISKTKQMANTQLASYRERSTD